MNFGAVTALLGVGGAILLGVSPADRSTVFASPGIVRMMGIIRSKYELDRYLAATAGSWSPLDYLSPAARRKFLSSIRYNATGITGFHYDGLQRELTVTQAYQVLALFGAQQDVAIIPHLRIATNEDRQTLSRMIRAENAGGR
jgi:hypothetical protein